MLCTFHSFISSNKTSCKFWAYGWQRLVELKSHFNKVLKNIRIIFIFVYIAYKWENIYIMNTERKSLWCYKVTKLQQSLKGHREMLEFGHLNCQTNCGARVTAHVLRINSPVCVVAMKKCWRLLTQHLLRWDVFWPTGPVSNPIGILHQDVHVPLLVQDLLFWLKKHTHTHIDHQHPTKKHYYRLKLTRKVRLIK